MDVYFLNHWPERSDRGAAEALRLVPDARLTRIDAGEGPAHWSASECWRDWNTGEETTDRQIACTANHVKAWAAIAWSGRPGLIVEDDLFVGRAVENGDLRADVTLLGYDLVGPAPRDLYGGSHHLVTERFAVCGGHCYATTSDAARRLIEAFRPHAVVPNDVYLSYHLGAGSAFGPMDYFADQEQPLKLTGWLVADRLALNGSGSLIDGVRSTLFPYDPPEEEVLHVRDRADAMRQIMQRNDGFGTGRGIRIMET